MGRSVVQGNSRLLIQQALDRQARQAGVGFTAGGDLSGTATDQSVAAIQGIATPDGLSAQAGDHLLVEAVLATPRALVLDGSTLWVGESGQPVAGTPYVTAFDVSDPALLQLVHKIDLSSVLPTVDRVRDLGQDDNYVYAACWDAQHVAIIEKATGTIAGWAYFPDANGARVLSCCSSGAGKLFAMVEGNFSGPWMPQVARWDLAACLGQPPATVAPEATCALPNDARHVRWGDTPRSLYVFDANFGTGIFRIDPITMTIVASYVQPASECYMTGVVAFGSVWAVDLYGPMLRLDPTTLAVQSSIALPGAGSPGPTGICLDATGVWVSDGWTPICWSVDQATNTPTAYVLPSYTDGVAADVANVFLAAYTGSAGPNTNGIVVLDPSVPSAAVQNPLALVYAPSPADSPVVVWRPAGPVDAPNVFQTWPEVMDACQAISGVKTIYVDAQTATVPPGDWDPGGYTILKGANPVVALSIPVTVEFNDARIKNIFEFEDVRMLAVGTAVSPLVQSYQGGGRVISYHLFGMSSIEVHPNGLPFMVIDPPAPPGRDVHFFMHDYTSTQTSGAAGPPLFVTTVNPCTLILHMEDGARFGQGSYQDTGGGAGPIRALMHSSHASVDTPQVTAIPESAVAGRVFMSGPGSPNGLVNGRVGDLWVDTNGGAGVTLWVKESSPTSNTGWVSK